MPVPSITRPSQINLRRSNPCSNSSNVDGPGARKKTKIQMGQWARRYAGLLRSRSFRPPASSTRNLLTEPEKTGYCPAGLAGVAGLGADVVAGGFEAGAGVAGAGALDAVFLSYSSIISFVISMLGKAYSTGVCCELTSTTMV